MYSKKLSIIIPTRNRQRYAAKCVETLLKMSGDDYEVIVHDNSDDDSLKGLLAPFFDSKKLFYAYSCEELSFCANFEKSVEMSHGDYLVMIGDDDCVFPEIVALTNALRKKNVDSVLFPTNTLYVWPNAVGSGGGTLTVRKNRFYLKKRRTAGAIEQMINKGNYDYQGYAFPKIYHGIIKREKLDQVKEKTGRYFGGLTPDIYSAVALSFVTSEIIYINQSFTLPGMCAKSGSADSVTGRHTGELSSAPHFRGNKGYQWNEKVPYLYTVDTIWAETAFLAMQDFGVTATLNQKQFLKFCTHIGRRDLSFCPRLAKEYVLRFGGNEARVQKRIEKGVKTLKRRIFIRKVWAYGWQTLRGRKRYYGVLDIEQAIHLVPQTNMKKVLKAIEKI